MSLIRDIVPKIGTTKGPALKEPYLVGPLYAKDDIGPARLRAESSILDNLSFGIMSFIKWESTISFRFPSFISKIFISVERFGNF